MNNGLLTVLNKLRPYQELLKRVVKEDVRVRVLPQARQALAASLFLNLGRSILLLSAKEERSHELEEGLRFFLPPGEVLIIPEGDNLLSQKPGNNVEVISALETIVSGFKERPLVVVSSLLALRQKFASPSELGRYFERLKVGAEVNLIDLEQRFYEIGYETQAMVDLPGSMSHRGGIIDIFPLNSQLPLRIEFYGNTIESLRLFDPVSQRSVKNIEEVEIGPVRVKAWEASLFDYLPSNTLILFDEPEDLREEAWFLDKEVGDVHPEAALTSNEQKPYLSWDELKLRLSSYRSITLESRGLDEGLELGFSSVPVFGGQVPNFLKEAKKLLSSGCRLIIVTEQSERLLEIFEDEGVPAVVLDELTRLPEPGSVVMVKNYLTRGWALGKTYLFTDNELFGLLKQRRPIKRTIRQSLKDFSPGDYVVHVDHGIAKFTGLATLEAGGSRKEYLVLEYAGSDKLYVPTDQVDRVERYTGAGDHPPTLNRLDGPEWSQAKKRAQESAIEVARDLLSIYATREVASGFAFSPDMAWQEEIESSFPYTETPDQLRAIEEVKNDMEAPRPMDRLVCGDVGYGKTEVALRAAFKAVMDGKQVAFLVPTTILAEQHYLTFTQRLSPFPFKVARLSRLQDAAEQREVIRGLAAGSVDICIGTHRLLQKDVSFKDLGLLIIDEEQRFGVLHKEFLKRMRHEVDVLTLTATPIPRTLYMSLVGVKDMSLMETPPEGRRPIKTFIGAYDPAAVRIAILRELERGGQVFFVHNRVRSINKVAQDLKQLLPEASVAVAHGQMDESDLEKVMVEFIRGEIDILVTTTIIESGLDVPNANTLIVDQADKLGLTQLYQLWGRVGRGSSQAYAYFLYEKGKELTPEAEKRLETMFEASKLGAGFDIALRDLEIRGAGDILGVKQSGHISAVGFNTYCRMLAEAVAEEKARLTGEERKASPVAPTIDLPLKALIPDEYVSDESVRIELYRRLISINRLEDVDEIRAEFEDRFGPVPGELSNLLYVLRLKIMALEAGISSITREGNEVVLMARSRFDKAKLQGLLPPGVRIGNTQIRADLAALGISWQQGLERLIEKLAPLVREPVARC